MKNKPFFIVDNTVSSCDFGVPSVVSMFREEIVKSVKETGKLPDMLADAIEVRIIDTPERTTAIFDFIK